MANERVVLEFSLQDVNNSIKGANKDAQTLRGTLESIQKISTKTSGSGKGGWKSAMMGGDAYDIARGSAGATGASGRDFANQARGLDGLVRLYATYAANLFAAGAAFRALSTAADTTNMVKGMDQLGAASGQALGTIAKNLVTATDGAISFRDSIEATTKGTAAGLSSKQMMQLGEVAKKASQALGVAMPDAISRLTRGISKLEPELLDELGLFTKIDKATQDYARSVGKTAGSLTDFERRQAFATAVLKEGLDKFSAIDISANPYDKLLASLQNLGQGALEIVNKFLGPLVSVLSQSPTALLAVITAIGVSILRSAIPALGHYRENLKNAAEQSRLTFTQIYKDQQAALSDLAANAALQAEATYRNSAGVRTKIANLQKEAQSFSKGKKDYSAIAGKDPFALTSEEIKSLDNRAKYLATRDAAEAARLKAHVATIKSLRAEAVQAGDVAQKTVEGKSEGILTTAGANDVIYKRKLTQASQDAIRVTVAETQAIYGMRAAFSKLGQELNLARAGMIQVQVGIDEAGNKIMQTAPKLSRLGTAYTAITSSIGILGQKLATTVSALNPWLIGIGIAVELFSLFDSWMTKTSKQSGVFNKALEANADAVANVNRTIDALSKKDPISASTISGIFALSNAMNELTSSTEASIYAAEKLKQAISKSNYDQFRNKILGLFGKDVDTELANTLANAVQSSLKLLTKAGRGDEAGKAFREALGIETLDSQALVKVFKENANAAEKFEAAQKKLNGVLGTSSSNLQNFKSATENSTKAYQEFIQSTANNNPLFKLGAALEDVSLSMAKIVKDGGVNDINAAFNDLADNPEKFAQFGQSFVDQFIAIRQEFKTTFQDYSNFNSAIQEIDRETEEKRARMAEIRSDWDWRSHQEELNELQAKLDSLQESRRMAGSKMASVDLSVLGRARELFVQGIDVAFTKGSELIAKALGEASAKAALTVAKAQAGILTGERAALESGRLKQKELDLQLSAINMNVELIASNASLRAAIDASTAATNLANSSEQDKSKLQAEKLAADAFKEALSRSTKGSQIKFSSTGDADADALLKLKIGQQNRQLAGQTAAATLVRGEKAATSIETERAALEGQLKDQEKLKGLAADINQQLINRQNILSSIGNAMNEEILQSIIARENSIATNKAATERQGIENAIALATKYNKDDEAAMQKAILALVERRQELEKDNKGIQDAIRLIDQRIAKENTLRDIGFQQREDTLKVTAAQISADQEMYNVKTSLGILFGEQAEYERKSLERATLSNSIAESQLSLEKARAKTLAEIDARAAKAKEVPGADLSLIEAERNAAVNSYNSQASALAIANQGKQRALDLSQSFTDRQIAYGEEFKKAFSGMADAVIEFTKTGKLNFTSMIDSMIEGLIRYEMQQQAMMMYAAFRPNLMNLVGRTFGFSGGFTNDMGGKELAGSLGFAKGGVFDAGLTQFAKGGMFTNSIVESPTLFKFAKGTGLMGEAGPEAIMPLKRDNNGNLGVRAGGNQGNVDVVVNNYGTEKAETKETVDSRGNRKIEVIIGEMTAGEMTRSGSASQKALRGTFGLQPQLIRR
jgi:lambda family phage tail tape measure protein